MELDNLKELWQSASVKEQPGKSGEELLQLLSRESQHPISRMKQNLRMEMAFMTIGYMIIIPFYFFFKKGNWNEIAWMYIFLFIVFGVYYFRKNKLLNDMACTSCQIKSNLELQIRTLEKYLHFYLYYGTALVALFYGYCGYLMYHKMTFSTPRNIFFNSPGYPWWQSLIAWFVMVVAVTWLTFVLQRHFLNKLYGKHVRRLKNLLNQMEETE